LRELLCLYRHLEGGWRIDEAMMRDMPIANGFVCGQRPLPDPEDVVRAWREVSGIESDEMTMNLVVVAAPDDRRRGVQPARAPRRGRAVSALPPSGGDRRLPGSTVIAVAVV
jgi:hypothetical protein